MKEFWISLMAEIQGNVSALLEQLLVAEGATRRASGER